MTASIIQQHLSPLQLRGIFVLEGSKEALQGVVDWSVETWGAGECERYDKHHKAPSLKPRRMRIFRHHEIKTIQSDIWYPVSGGPYTRAPERYILEVAVWGKDQSALFKLRWA